MSRTTPFSLSTRELTKSLTVTPSQKSDSLCFTIHSSLNPAGSIGCTLDAGQLQKLVKHLQADLPELLSHFAPPVHTAGSPG